MVIRTVTARDVDAITDLGIQLGYDIDPSSVEAALRQAMGPAATVLVAEAGGRVIGWVHGYESVLLQHPHPFVEIGGLVVDQEERNTGVGRALMQAIERWAESRGIAEIRVRSNSVRHQAHEFYERLGYVNEKSSYTFSKQSQ